MDTRPRFRRPFRESWRRYLPALTVLVLVSALAAGGTLYEGSRDKNAAQERFIAMASEELANFGIDAVDRKVDIESLARSYVLAIQQDRTARTEYQPRLNLLFSSIGGRHQDLARADIILKITGGDRAAFEAYLSSSTGGPAQITSIDKAGQVVRAADSPEYYPVVFIEPSNLANHFIGLTLQSTPALASAIDQAKLTGLTAVTGPMSGFSESGDGSGYAVLAPIYAPGAQTPGSASLPIGFAVGYQLYEKLLGRMRIADMGIEVYLYDSASDNPDKPVVAYPTSAAENNEARLSKQRNDGASLVKAIDQNGHTWHVVASPGAPFAVGRMFWYTLVSSLFFLTLMGAYLLTSVRRTLELEGAEIALKKSNEELTVSAAASNRRAREMTHLADLSDMLQSCQESSAAFEAISLFVPKIFKDLTGAVYLLNTARDTAEMKATWGNGYLEESFRRDACAALRRSSVHKYIRDRDTLQCGHVGDPPPASHVCAPMLAQDEAFGILYLSSADEINDETYDMAQTVAEHLAMALTNIELRTILKEQSVTDPLTKLFNRRFMENLFEREIRRADRSKTGIGVIMLDIDLFKQVNDTYGHAAGDLVLETLGTFLRTSVRMEDYVCRYGGEEFLLVLPGSNKKHTLRRAVDIRERAETVEYLFNGINIGPIKLSGGVSSYPNDGVDQNAVINAADAALYAAKAAGRNQIKEAGAFDG